MLARSKPTSGSLVDLRAATGRRDKSLLLIFDFVYLLPRITSLNTFSDSVVVLHRKFPVVFNQVPCRPIWISFNFYPPFDSKNG